MSEPRPGFQETTAPPGDVGGHCYAPSVDQFFAFLDAEIEKLQKLAAPLGWKLPRVRDPALARRIALGLHVLLAHLVKGWGAIDIAIGEGLASLDDGLRVMKLGYSNVQDYAREELGMNASTAAKSVRLARKLRDFPLTRELVRQGRLTPRKAEVIAPHLTREREPSLLLLAMENTVRGLHAKLKEPRDPDEGKWFNLSCELEPDQQLIVRTAMALAGWVLDRPTATALQRLQAMLQEYLGSHEAPPDDHADDAWLKAADERDAVEEHLENQHARWKDLPVAPPVPAPEAPGESDPFRIDPYLKGLVDKRRRWDDSLGQVVLLFKTVQGWHHLGFGSFEHYCREALGVGERALAQRAALERGLLQNPILRQALQENRLSYEKARLIARGAAPGQVAHWIEKAEKLPCIELRRQLEAKSEAQMCAQGIFRLAMPASIAELLKGTFRAVRAAAQRCKSVSEWIVAVAIHFYETYEYLLERAKTLQQRIRERDGHLCQVPGCSRAATHAHHIHPRARGGPDEDWNLISLCTAHHLFGIHGGKLEVSGRAPDKLVWKFKTRQSYAQTAVP